MHQIKFTTLLIVFLQILISLAFANASSKLENNLKLSKLIDLENPWGMDLIDSDNILITEKKGTLSIYNFLNKKIIEKIYFKDVFLKRQGGLLDVLYIKHNKKQFVYTCYQDLKTDLVIARHEIKKNKFFNKKIIFNSEHRSNNGVHFGCRMIDYKGSILISLGDRGDRNNSQNPKNYPGTILKLNYQGIPDVNGYGTGDQLVHVNVWTPKKLSSEEKKILEGLRNSPNFEPKPSKSDKGFFEKVKEFFN